MTTMQMTPQMTPQTSQADARFQAAQPNTVPFRTTTAHTWYLTGRKLHAWSGSRGCWRSVLSSR